MQRVAEGVEHVIMYLDNAITFDVSPIAYVCPLREFRSRLRAHHLKVSVPKARLGATKLDFLGY